MSKSALATLFLAQRLAIDEIKLNLKKPKPTSGINVKIYQTHVLTVQTGGRCSKRNRHRRLEAEEMKVLQKAIYREWIDSPPPPPDAQKD